MLGRSPNAYAQGVEDGVSQFPKQRCRLLHPGTCFRQLTLGTCFLECFAWWCTWSNRFKNPTQQSSDSGVGRRWRHFWWLPGRASSLRATRSKSCPQHRPFPLPLHPTKRLSVPPNRTPAAVVSCAQETAVAKQLAIYAHHVPSRGPFKKVPVLPNYPDRTK